MLHTPVNSFEFYYTNAPSPGALGTSVVPGASNAEGAWTQIASSANIATNIYWVSLSVTGGSTSAAIKNHALDIGVDNAGGSSYTSVIPDVLVSSSAPNTLPGSSLNFSFPLLIKAGSSVAVRVLGSNATAGTVNVGMEFYGMPTRPELVPVGTYAENIGGLGGNAIGDSFTPGSGGTEGAWTQLSTPTASDMWWWQLGLSCTNATMTALSYTFDVAYGDASTKVMLIENWRIITGTAESIGHWANMAQTRCAKPVPGGSTLYVRGSCSGAPVTGWSASVIGIG